MIGLDQIFIITVLAIFISGGIDIREREEIKKPKQTRIHYDNTFCNESNEFTSWRVA